MRPSPTMPSVLSASSTPSHLLRSQRPATSAEWAWGTLRAWASSSAIVCSAADTMLLCGALTTITPRVGGGVDVDVVEPDAGPADDEQVGAGGEHLVGDRGRRADDQGVGADDRLEQLLGGQPALHVDLVAGGAEAVQPAVGDLFGDEDAGHRTTCLPPPLRRHQRVEHKAHRPTRSVRRATSEPRWHSEPNTRIGQPVRSGVVAADALAGIERWFVERGLPHFVERHDTAAEIWGRALPLLIAAYLLLGLNALDICGVEPGQEPRRRRVRARRRRRDLGRRQPRCAAAAGSSGRTASAPPSWPCSSIVPAVPSLLVGQWGDAAPDGGHGDRHPRPAVGDHQLRRALAAAVGVAAHHGPARRCCSTSSSGPCRCCCCSRRSCSSTPRCGRSPGR